MLDELLLDEFLFPLVTYLDALALGIFFLCYGSYLWLGHHPPKGQVSLRHAMHYWRQRWMESLTYREVRIMDTQLLGHIMHSVTFFASTSILIIAGITAAFSSAEAAADALSSMPFVKPMSTDQFALKLMLPLGFVVYAFFVLTMGLRQFNYACVIVGSLPNVPDTSERQAFIKDAAEVLGLATNSFNAGLRSYYFALASMGWFFHPVVLVVCAIGVTALLYHRQMHSPTVRALMRAQTPTLPSSGDAPR